MQMVATATYMAEERDPSFPVYAIRYLMRHKEQPSMLVGDPEIDSRQYEDEGRTLRIPVSGSQKLWAIRDDYLTEEESVITLLLPEDY